MMTSCEVKAIPCEVCCPTLRRLAMSNVDKPDEVAFARAIAENLPSHDDKTKQLAGLGLSYLLGRAVKYVSK